METFVSLAVTASAPLPGANYVSRKNEANWAGFARKSGGTLDRIRKTVLARDSFVCQKCGLDCGGAYLQYLADLATWKIGGKVGSRPAPVLVAAHLVSHNDNGINGLNINRKIVDGVAVIYRDTELTVSDLRSCGYSEEDIISTLNNSTYRADYDKNNLEAWCPACNSAEADSIGHGRGVDVLLTKTQILQKIARAYALNKAGA